MPTQCDLVDLFADNELGFFQKRAFRLHLEECQRCRVELAEICNLQLMLSKRLVVAPAVSMRQPADPRRFAGRFARYSMAACLAMLLLAGLPTALFGGSAPVWTQGYPALAGWASTLLDPSASAFKGVKQRALEGRLTYGPADVYRPFGRATALMGGGDVPELQARRPESRRAHGAFLASIEGNFQGAQKDYEELLVKEPDNLDLASDLAATLIPSATGWSRAWKLLDSVLAKEPGHRQALWNRALLLQEMGLPFLAAKAFEDFAASGEPGWAEEARQRAAQLREGAATRYRVWQRADEDGRKLVDPSQPPPQELLETGVPILQFRFYEAIRASPSAERVRALRPLAARFGSTALLRYMDRVAERSFSQRGPRVATYERLCGEQLSRAEEDAFVDELWQAGDDDDLLLAALACMEAPRKSADAIRARLHGLEEDPWFQALIAQVSAKAPDLSDAQRVPLLKQALEACDETVRYRCLALRLQLTEVLLKRDLLEEAHASAFEGLKQSRDVNEWEKELGFLQLLGQVARFRLDLPMERAYLSEELELARGDGPATQHAHQNLAAVALHELKFDTARSEIDLALSAGRSLSLNGAYVLADLSRVKPAPGDAAAIEGALSRLEPRFTPGDQAFALHIRGRFDLRGNAPGGRALLWQAIREADVILGHQRPGDADTNALRARTYSYSALIMDAGASRDFEKAFTLFADELGRAPPARCSLALTAETERRLFVARSATGVISGRYEEAKARLTGEDFTPGDFITAAALEGLRSCEDIQVFSRVPLLELAKLFPPEFTWHVALSSSPATPPAPGSGIRLQISNVAYAPERDVRPLSWVGECLEGQRCARLEGARATPSEVQRRMRDASEIEMATHGRVKDASGEAFLILASEEQGDELTASQIRAEPLPRRPIVYLAACEGSLASPTLHQQRSLPAAFIEAGARAVFAAEVEVPDTGMNSLVRDLQRRIHGGESPAHALREERVARLKAEPWVRSILLFE